MPVGTRGVGPSRAGLAEQPHLRRRSNAYTGVTGGVTGKIGVYVTRSGGVVPFPRPNPHRRRRFWSATGGSKCPGRIAHRTRPDLVHSPRPPGGGPVRSGEELADAACRGRILAVGHRVIDRSDRTVEQRARSMVRSRVHLIGGTSTVAFPSSGGNRLHHHLPGWSACGVAAVGRRGADSAGVALRLVGVRPAGRRSSRCFPEAGGRRVGSCHARR